MEFEPEVTSFSQQALMKELGFTEDDTTQQTSSSDSESEASELSKHHFTPIETTPIPCSWRQVHELKQMLRDTQRKLHCAQSALADSEQKREQRMKIIRKTHQSALALKHAVITELQDIIAEKDECISQLKAQVANSHCSTALYKPVQTEGLQKLVEQVLRLQKENLSLQARNAEIEQQMEELLVMKDKLQEELFIAQGSPFKLLHVSDSVPLLKKVRELQQKLLSWEQERETRGTVEKKLRHQVTELKSQVRTLQNEKETLLQEIRNSKEDPTQVTSLTLELQNAKDKQEKLLAELENKVAVEVELKQQLQKSQLQLQHQHEQYSQDVSALQQELQRKFEKVCMDHASTVELLQAQLLNTRLECAATLRETEKRTVRKEEGAFTKVKLSLPRIHCSSVEAGRAIQELKCAMESFRNEISLVITNTSRKICQCISDISQCNKGLVSKYHREMSLRKALHNKLVELRGNIRVLCRVRPPITEDGEGLQATVVVKPDTEDDTVVRVFNKGVWKDFEVDKVFPPQSTQQEVFAEVENLVTSCMDGYNVCIFAYGQTGAGKTYTMEGPAESPGINQRTLNRLFEVVSTREVEWNYSVHVSLLEIYNENVFDLLCTNHMKKLEVKQGQDGMYVPGLSQVQVYCVEDVNKVLAHGQVNRATGATQMNIQSSRSHALLCVAVKGENKVTGVVTLGKLNLIDLAGSERLDKSGSEGVRMQEAKYINKSLSALGDVIHSLRKKSSHIPYRNSKLTFLLSDSLSGDSKTLMVVHVASVEKNAGETVCSLTFAHRIRSVELGQATRKILTPSSTPKHLGPDKLYQGSPTLLLKTKTSVTTW